MTPGSKDQKGPARGLPVAFAALSIVVLTWPLLLHPRTLLAHRMGEGVNHYWMLWRAFQSGMVANIPEGLVIPIMDPVNLPLAAPFALFDPVLAYNAVVVANLALAFVGAFVLARELGATHGATVAGVAAVSAPFLSGVVDFGLTESMPIGWLGLHAAMLLRHGRTGGWRAAVAAGLFLGLFALSGWYHAAFGLVVEAVLLPWVLLRHRRPLGTLGQGLIAAVMVIPALLRYLAVQSFWDERWHAPSPFPPEHRPQWRDLPVYGTDLLNLILPSLESVEVSKAVYLGLVTLGLAIAGGRRSAPLFAICLPLWVLALGHWLGIGGSNVTFGRPIPLPAKALSPMVEGLSHWHRAVGPSIPFLAAAAGLGAERLGRWAPAAAILLLVDSVALSQTPWPRRMTDAAVPAVYEALPGQGAVVQLPLDNGRRQFAGELPRTYNLWQPGFGRPVAENYEGPDAIAHQNRLVAVADALCGVEPTVPRRWQTPRSMLDERALESETGLAASVRQLAGFGVDVVVLHPERAATPDAARALLTRALGVPDEVDGALVFRVPGEGVR